MYDPDADDEMVIDENTAGVEVGGRRRFTAYAPDEMPFSGPASGVHVDVDRSSGGSRTIAQFLFIPDGQAFLSPGFAAEHGDDALLVENADVQLRDGAGDIAALQRSVDELVAPGTPVLDLHEAARRVGTTTTRRADRSQRPGRRRPARRTGARRPGRRASRRRRRPTTSRPSRPWA